MNSKTIPVRRSSFRISRYCLSILKWNFGPTLKLGKTSLNFNINIDNLFNAGTATSFYQYRDLFGLNVWNDQILANNWDLGTPGVNLTPDPRFMKAMNFYPPIAARLGARFSF